MEIVIWLLGIFFIKVLSHMTLYGWILLIELFIFWAWLHI